LSAIVEQESLGQYAGVFRWPDAALNVSFWPLASLGRAEQ
jgi:hypothetical protein